MAQTLRTITNFYRLDIARNLVLALRAHDDSVAALFRWFMRTKTYRMAGKLGARDLWLVHVLMAAMLLQIAVGLAMIIDWSATAAPGRWAFGLALVLSYPVVAAVFLAIGTAMRRFVWYAVRPKQWGKALLAHVLEDQIIRLRMKHHFTVVAVAGSVGKTTSKLAIAELLGQNLRVRYEEGNYNDRLTVPLTFFGHTQPSIFNLFGWLRIIGDNAARLEHPYPYDVVVVEIGTDAPGQMKHFAYLKPDITVLTAVTPEHMQAFGTLDAVAEEELSVFEYSHHVLVNVDAVAPKYLVGKKYTPYSLQHRHGQGYSATSSKSHLGGQELQIETPSGSFSGFVQYVGAQGAVCALAAVAVADMLGLKRSAIAEALRKLEPFSGRMQVLAGIKDSKLIDDTYNASPEAVTAALDVLYGSRAKQRIAVLGSMNEMGGYAREAHTIVGSYCDSRKLDLVLTLGRDAERWIAPAARAQGCAVRSFSSQSACAAYVRKHLKPGAVVLVKGSQNGVFAEEVVKQLLAHPADARKLVRQSAAWMRKKAR